MLEPTINLYRNHTNIIPFSKLCMIQNLILIYKIKNNLIKHNFDITYRHDTHCYRTRQADHINVPQSTTNTGANNIMSRGVILFNNLPNFIKNTKSIAQFKHDLHYYINTQ